MHRLRGSGNRSAVSQNCRCDFAHIRKTLRDTHKSALCRWIISRCSTRQTQGRKPLPSFVSSMADEILIVHLWNRKKQRTGVLHVPLSARYARSFPRKQGKLICCYPEPSPFDGEGGPRKWWKGHKEGALYEVLSFVQQPRSCVQQRFHWICLCKGITDKFSHAILTYLFCPHFGGKSST